MKGPRAWRSDVGALDRVAAHRSSRCGRRQCTRRSTISTHGATGLSLIFHGAASGHGFGLHEHDEATLARALAGIRLDCIALRMEPGPHGRRVAEALAALIAKQPVDPERLDLDFGLDPIGALAARGDLDAPWPEIAGRVLATVEDLRGRNFAGPFMRADGRIWHDGGATEAEELGFDTRNCGRLFARA